MASHQLLVKDRGRTAVFGTIKTFLRFHFCLWQLMEENFVAPLLDAAAFENPVDFYSL